MQQVDDPDLLALPGWDPREVSDSPQALLATNDASIIVAVSTSALRVLGYAQSDELVGLPVTHIVPARYQQAHIAGTTLHAINGRDPLLGIPVTVPVVLAGGQEAMRQLTVGARSLVTGRTVFVAEFVTDGVETG